MSYVAIGSTKFQGSLQQNRIHDSIKRASSAAVFKKNIIKLEWRGTELYHMYIMLISFILCNL